MSLPPEAVQVFQNTSFRDNYKKAIWKDICVLRETFPYLQPSNYPATPYSMVLIQGYVNISVQGNPSILPLNMSLPQNFPDAPPVAVLQLPQNVPFTPNQYVDARRIINSSSIFQWIPRKSLLKDFVQALVNFFSQYPPFPINYTSFVLQQFASLKPYNPGMSSGGHHHASQGGNNEKYQEEAIIQAKSLISQLNETIREYHNTECEYQCNQYLCNSLRNKKESLEKEVKQYQAELSNAKNKKIEDYQIESEVETAFEQEARTETFQTTLENLRNDLHNNTITIEYYLSAVKEANKIYFENCIYPRCN